MQVTEIFTTIEKTAPLHAAAHWDCSGLQVAAHRREASALAVCLDPTPASIQSALDQGAQCILSHHPLALKPALPNTLDDYHAALRLLLTADVPLYAAHTSLDVNGRGPAGWIAQEAALTNLAVLEVTAQAPACDNLPLGFGLAGTLPAPLTLEGVIQLLSKHLDLTNATICGPKPQAISRMAYCTGSGASLLEAAHEAGAQLFITGDVKYHTALTAGICLLDVGHHGPEEEMMRRMSLLLRQDLEGVRVFFVPSASPLRPLHL